MQIDTHETDLYILPETSAERHNLQSFLETKQWGYIWVFSDVPGNSWYGKQICEIPCGINLIKELKERFNIC